MLDENHRLRSENKIFAFDKEKNTECKTIEKQYKQEDHDKNNKSAAINEPVKVFYQHRDILDLSYLRKTEKFVQYTVLPKNNVNCFFQNRAQYWRLSSSEKQDDIVEKCRCCEFTYPTCNQLNQKCSKNVGNSITNSLLSFLKGTDNTPPPISFKCLNNNMQFTNQIQSHQYQAPVAGLNNQPYINSGTSLTLLNLMNNASRITASAFQISNRNNTQYGLYKQF